jgi:hypothetical protein
LKKSLKTGHETTKNCMKTQIIQLEAHDDAHSVRDKMGWSQAARIVLVLPQKTPILNRRLDLLLVQRRSQDLGVQLALVTKHPEVRYAARQLNIPVFKHLRQAQAMNWRTGRRRSIEKRPERRNPQPDLQALKEDVHPLHPAWYETKTARKAYYSLTLLIFLAAAGFIMPGAEIYLVPEKMAQSIIYQAAASEQINTANITGGFPVNQQDLVVEGQLEVTITNTVKAPASEASGSVTFTNMTEKTVRIEEGTIVVAPGDKGQRNVRFIITRSGTVPAGLGKTFTLPVRSFSPGIDGNILADKITAIEGPLGLSLSVTNKAPITGGSEREISSPSINDYSQLKAELLKKLHQQALEDIQQLSNSGLPLLPTLLLEEILDEGYTPPLPADDHPPNPAENLTLNLKAAFSVQAVAHSDMLSISDQIMNAHLPVGYIAVPGSLELTHLGSPVAHGADVYRWKIKADRQIETSLPFDKVVQAVRGLPMERAADQLRQTFDLADEPVVVVTPDWWPLMPMLPMRIKLLTGYAPFTTPDTESLPSPPR